MYAAYPTFTTELSEILPEGQDWLIVDDIGDDCIPPASEEDPNSLTLVDLDNKILETVEYTGKIIEENKVTGLTRGKEGIDREWAAGTMIGRMRTALESNQKTDILKSIPPFMIYDGGDFTQLIMEEQVIDGGEI